MKLVTYQNGKMIRPGIWSDAFILDIQAAGLYIFGGSAEGQRFASDYESMMTMLVASERIFPQLQDFHSRIRNENENELYRRGVLIPKEQTHLLAPLASPGKVICVGGNFPSTEAAQKPDYPTFFLKPSSSITAVGMPIWISEITKNVAFEVELAAVIGRRTRHVTPQDALAHVAGYILANDIGDRLLEKRTSQWTSGKMFDSFTPMGPWLATKDEIPHPDSLEMSTLVNGQLVQQGNTGEMFFGIPELVSILSELTTLLPGDLILTGSPKMMDGRPNPVLALQPGDSVTIQIDGLGELANPVEEEHACL